jgi:hypothetical protein
MIDGLEERPPRPLKARRARFDGDSVPDSHSEL